MASGKYLAVDSKSALQLAPQGASLEGSAKRERVAFHAALVDDADSSIPEGLFGSPSSLLFYLAPIAGSVLKVRALASWVYRWSSSASAVHLCSSFHFAENAVFDKNSSQYAESALRIEHRPVHGQKLFLTSCREPKHRFRKLSAESDAQNSSALKHNDHRGLRLVFSAEQSAVDVLKVVLNILCVI